MTEQETELKRVISFIRSCREAGIDTTIITDKSRSHLILNALEEIQQYRALGTVRQIEDFIADWRKYRELGNLEELREAMEKQRAKKPFIQKMDEKTLYKCPCCKKIFVEAYESLQRGYIPKYCEMCGQSIDF